MVRRSDKLKETLIKLLFVDTAKRLRIKAQRCRASRLRWEEDDNSFQPQRGCGLIGNECGFALKTQPRWGWNVYALATQGCRETRQPWALMRNRFAVKNSRTEVNQRSLNDNLKSEIFNLKLQVRKMRSVLN